MIKISDRHYDNSRSLQCSEMHRLGFADLSMVHEPYTVNRNMQYTVHRNNVISTVTCTPNLYVTSPGITHNTGRTTGPPAVI